MQVFLKKYGSVGTIDFTLHDITGTDILTSASFSSGCAILSLDEGTSALTCNLPVVRSNGFSLTLSATELTCKRAYIKLVDSQWLATSFVIETYGTSASEHGDIASGLMHRLVDTVPLEIIIENLLALISGEVIKNGDQYSWMKRDNSTPSFTTSAAAGQRIRIS